LDRERSAFGLKESRLADYYIDILGLAKTSHDAFALKNWEQTAKTVYDLNQISLYIIDRVGRISQMLCLMC
jgi:hypothetical protein